MKKNSISEFELEREDFKVKLKRGYNTAHAQSEDGPLLLAPPSAATGVPSSGQPSVPESTDANIASPMIGTFYRAPSPDASPYAEIGSEVDPDTVVCIIEAMKVMNEIKAETKGVITEILVDNAKPIEFGQVLFKVRPR